MGLHRQEHAAGIHEIDRRQSIFQSDLLGPEMFLDRHGEVGPPFDRRVVGGDDTWPSRHVTDAGDQTGSRDVVVVHVGCRQGTEFQPRRAWIKQLRDPLTGGQLASLSMKRDSFRRPTSSNEGKMLLEVGHQALIVHTIRGEFVGRSDH